MRLRPVMRPDAQKAIMRSFVGSEVTRRQSAAEERYGTDGDIPEGDA